jgi:hypothetical protein
MNVHVPPHVTTARRHLPFECVALVLQGGGAQLYNFGKICGRTQAARHAIKRQSENKSGKLTLDKVANATDELIKISSLISKVALPRGLEPLFSP